MELMHYSWIVYHRPKKRLGKSASRLEERSCKKPQLMTGSKPIIAQLDPEKVQLDPWGSITSQYGWISPYTIT